MNDTTMKVRNDMRRVVSWHGQQGLHKHRGAALPAALVLASMVLAMSTVSFDIAVAGIRRASNLEDAMRAEQAADAALTLCLRALDAGVAPSLPAVAEPLQRWRHPDVFADPFAFAPMPHWAGAARTPQCIIEGWRIAHRPRAQVHVLTARGFGAADSAEVWLQLVVVREAGLDERHWRRIAARSR